MRIPPTRRVIPCKEGPSMAEATATSHTGTFVWNEIGTTDVEACKAFYKALFQWKTRELDMGPNGVYTKSFEELHTSP